MFQQHRHSNHVRRRCACERRSVNSIDINNNVHKRSLCRWSYEWNYDETRKPACLYKVTGCINTVGHLTDNQCEMVKVDFPIRRKSGSFWLEDSMDLPVACTLASPPIDDVPFLRSAGDSRLQNVN